MFSRPIAWFCCLLTALAPTLLVASVTAHAHEHSRAASGAMEHGPCDGHVPHHRHDPDGQPIPASLQATFLSARPACGDTLSMPSAAGQPLFTALFDVPHGVSPVSVRAFVDRRSRSPTVPSPGDILPLLI